MYAPNQDLVARRAAFSAWQRDRNNFIHEHKPEIDKWVAEARLVEMHFVPDHAVYNTATIDSVQIKTPSFPPSSFTREPRLPTP
jgi:hypothetical protein